MLAKPLVISAEIVDIEFCLAIWLKWMLFGRIVLMQTSIYYGQLLKLTKVPDGDLFWLGRLVSRQLFEKWLPTEESVSKYVQWGVSLAQESCHFSRRDTLINKHLPLILFFKYILSLCAMLLKIYHFNQIHELLIELNHGINMNLLRKGYYELYILSALALCLSFIHVTYLNKSLSLCNRVYHPY